MDSLMSMMQSQINRAIHSAISDRVIPEIQNIMGSLSSGQRDTESGTSVDNQNSSEDTVGLKTEITKKDSRSAFDLSFNRQLKTFVIFVLETTGNNMSPTIVLCSH